MLPYNKPQIHDLICFVWLVNFFINIKTLMLQRLPCLCYRNKDTGWEVGLHREPFTRSLVSMCISAFVIKEKWQTARRSAERTYVGELAHSIGFDSDVVLLELLLDLINARGDVLGLRVDKGERTNNRHQIELEGGVVSGVKACYQAPEQEQAGKSWSVCCRYQRH